MGIPFGRYELLKRIAAGGMGEVFLARQTGMQGFEKLLVVKVLLPHLVEDQEFVTMFLDEARIAARLNHPNVAQIFDLGQSEDGNLFIAMEYIHGDDIVRLWKAARAKARPVPLALAVRIAADAAAGLDYAHKSVDSSNRPLGLVHRDVSPQNILVTFDGGVKLIDFGVAKAAGRASHTATGTLKGKYSYMSPEQAGGKPIDARSDVFALVVVLYEMATGLRLFKRENDVMTLKAVEACEIPPPSEANPEIDSQLEAVLSRALAKALPDRYPDAMAFRLALEDWLVQKRLPGSAAHLAAFMQELYAERLAEERAEGKPFTEFEGTPSAVFRHSGVTTNSRPSRSGTMGLPPAVEPPRPSRLPLFAGLGAAVAVLAGVLGFLLWPKPPPPPPPAATLSIVTRPAGARVLVDGALAGTTPIDRLALPGKTAVAVEVGLEGYQTIRQDVLARGDRALDLTLEKVPAAPPKVEEVVLRLTSVPEGATVSLGSQELGRAPMEYRVARADTQLAFTFKLAGFKAETRSAPASSDGEVRAVLVKAGGRPPRPGPEDPGLKIGR